MSKKQKTSPTRESTHSYIEPHEEQKAKDLITESLGFEPPRTCGYQITLKLHLTDDDNKCVFYDKSGKKIVSSILKTDTAKSMERYQTCVGLVVAMGPDCYQGDRFKHTGPWCKIGDFVVYPRHEGTQLLYRGTFMHVVNDDKIFWVISDPTYVTKE
jgi:co-chaperonin GroES (HSP10)